MTKNGNLGTVKDAELGFPIRFLFELGKGWTARKEDFFGLNNKSATSN